jgi:hypothetical protein
VKVKLSFSKHFFFHDVFIKITSIK